MKDPQYFFPSRLDVRLEKGLKQDAAEVLCEFGLSLSEAVKMFLRQVVIQKKIPFTIQASAYPFREPGTDPELEAFLKSYEKKKTDEPLDGV